MAYFPFLSGFRSTHKFYYPKVRKILCKGNKNGDKNKAIKGYSVNTLQGGADYWRKM